GDMTVNSGSDIDGVLSVGGDLTILGAADIGDGDADTFSVGGDMIVGNDIAMPSIVISGPGNTTSIVGGTLFINAGATVSGVDDENHTLTVDAVNIHEQTGGGPPNGTFYLGDDNTLVVQGSFVAGTFIGTDSDAPDDGDHALLAFVLDDNTTFAPGPNTQLCDFSAFGNEETLFVNTSFEVQCDAHVLDDTTLDLTDVLMRMTGPDGMLNISTDAEVSGDPTKGAVSFEGTDVDLDGFIATIAPEAASVGHITSFIVNDPVGFDDVTTSGPLVVDGIMSLAFGGFTTGANTITWSGPDAGIIINTDGTGADITLSPGGSMAGSWDATWNGTNTVMGGTPGVELDPTKNNDLHVNTTGIATVLDVAPLGPGGSISISGDFNVGNDA
ncbi:MAG: hypothetical protein R3330_17405, partial [Saprospiraceae bacterium]|nr:hypothetical protein [Saprospiraceae bacterium]